MLFLFVQRTVQLQILFFFRFQTKQKSRRLHVDISRIKKAHVCKAYNETLGTFVTTVKR